MRHTILFDHMCYSTLTSLIARYDSLRRLELNPKTNNLITNKAGESVFNFPTK